MILSWLCCFCLHIHWRIILNTIRLLKKYVIEKSCTKIKFTSTLFKGWQGSRGQRPLSLPQKRNSLN